MKRNWFFAKDYHNTSYQQQFGELELAFTQQGTAIDSSPISQTKRIPVYESTEHVYVKKYYGAGKNLRRFIGRSEARGEWENLRIFKQLNIPTPNVIACGEQRGFLFYDRGILVMEEITHAKDLRYLLLEKSPLLKNKNWVLNVAQQVTDYARRLHRRRFIHGDLKFRNILIKHPEKNPTAYLIDCPIGRRRFGFLFERARIKELFELDKYARLVLSKTMRLRCYLLYIGKNKRLTAKDKKVIRKIMQRHSNHSTTRLTQK